MIEHLQKGFGAMLLRRFDNPDGNIMHACETALGARGASVQAPVRKEGDFDKCGGVKDPGGNTWWIATRIN